MFFLYLDPHLLLLWNLVTLPFSHLQAPLCLPVTQNNSKNRHNYSLISWPMMRRAWWNILYPLIFPQGGAGDQEHWLNAPIRGHSSLIESQMFQQATSPNHQFPAILLLWKHCHFHKPPESLQFLFWHIFLSTWFVFWASYVWSMTLFPTRRKSHL